MSKFSFAQLVGQSQDYFNAKLGTGSPLIVDADVGFPMKLGADSTYIKCADGDQIEAFLVSLEPNLADGVNFGTLNDKNFHAVTVTGAIAIGDYLVAATTGLVKKAAAVDPDVATTVQKYIWRYESGGVGSSGTHTGIARRIGA